MIEKPTKTFSYTIRVSKEDSAYLYFQLEANDGLCFYSTLQHETGQTYRDIHIQGSSSLISEFKHLLERLSLECNIELLTRE